MPVIKHHSNIKKDKYEPEPTLIKKYPNGPVVSWYSPRLTPAEKEQRMNELKEATVRFMKHVFEVRER